MTLTDYQAYVDRQYGLLLRTARMRGARDPEATVQNLCLRMLLLGEDGHPRYARIPSANPDPYMFRALTNVVRSEQRKQPEPSTLTAPENQASVSAHDVVEEEENLRRLPSAMAEAVRELSESERRALIALAHNGSREGAANQLGWEVQKLRLAVCRAVSKLRKVLAEHQQTATHAEPSELLGMLLRALSAE